MASLSTASAEDERPKNPYGEAAAKQIIAKHNGIHFLDVCAIATEIGAVHSGCDLSDKRAREIVLQEFNRRKIDDLHWSTVHEAFLNGRASVITTVQLRERYSPVAANDNDEPEEEA